MVPRLRGKGQIDDLPVVVSQIADRTKEVAPLRVWCLIVGIDGVPIRAELQFHTVTWIRWELREPGTSGEVEIDRGIAFAFMPGAGLRWSFVRPDNEIDNQPDSHNNKKRNRPRHQCLLPSLTVMNPLMVAASLCPVYLPSDLPLTFLRPIEAFPIRQRGSFRRLDWVSHDKPRLIRLTPFEDTTHPENYHKIVGLFPADRSLDVGEQARGGRVVLSPSVPAGRSSTRSTLTRDLPYCGCSRESMVWFSYPELSEAFGTAVEGRNKRVGACQPPDRRLQHILGCRVTRLETVDPGSARNRDNHRQSRPSCSR